MRQTTHLYLATVAAALAMSCALPYATRASLDLNERNEVAAPSVSSQMPVAMPLEYVGFPAGEIQSNADWPSIDMFMITPQGFVALSNNLNKEVEWPDKVPVAITSKPAIRRSARSDARNGGQDTFRISHNRAQPTFARIAFSKPVLAPVAFVRFCIQYSDDCKVSAIAFDRSPVPLTSARWSELTKVNSDVNRAIKPEENLGGVMAEEWLVSPHHGDCNDYAVTKRHELLALGWPSNSLLLAEVVIASGEHHLVLVVRTSEHDFVLDNLNANVRPVTQVEYRWVRAQQAENPKFWATINVGRVDHVAMNRN